MKWHPLSSLIFCLSLLATAPNAQDRQVTLQSINGTSSVSGVLISVDDQAFVLRTRAGDLAISADAVRCLGAACPTPAPVFVIGETVALTSHDGSVNVSGTLIAVDDSQFVIDAGLLGQLELDRALVTCDGAGCPARETDPSARDDDPQIAQTSTAALLENLVANAVELAPDLRFAGSDTIGLGLMPDLVAGYAAFNGGTVTPDTLSETQNKLRMSGTARGNAIITATQSGDAFVALAAGAADFGMMSRPARDADVGLLTATGASDPRGTINETVVAVDGLAVLTHPSNPVRALSLSQIAAIYRGQITNWADLGGPDAPIAPYSRAAGSGSRATFEAVVFPGEDARGAAETGVTSISNKAMVAAISADPTAIGYASLAFAKGVNTLDITGACGLVSRPDAFDLRSAQYPLGRRLYLYNVPDGLHPAAQAFLDYARSPAADDAITQAGFVNFAVDRQPQSRARIAQVFENLSDPQAADLAGQLRRDLDDWDRLSTTIRFATGGSDLGAKELNDLTRLVAYLGDLPAGTAIAVVGFADSTGPFDQNLTLSDQRAATVASRLRALGAAALNNVTIETKSYGELAPAVCNDTGAGQAINRRVEIWVSKG